MRYEQRLGGVKPSSEPLELDRLSYAARARGAALLVVATLALVLVARDWNQTPLPPLASEKARLGIGALAIAVALLAALYVGRPRLNSREAARGRWIFGVVVCWVLLAEVLERVHLSPADTVMQRTAYVGFPLAFAWVFAGYRIVVSLNSAERLFSWIAALGAAASAASYILLLMGRVPVTGLDRFGGSAAVGPLFGVPTWGARLFMAFAFIWYLNALLQKPRSGRWELVGFLLSTYVVTTLIKSTVLPTLIGAACIAVLAMYASPRRSKTLKRLLLLLLVALVAVTLADLRSEGSLADRLTSRYFGVARTGLLSQDLTQAAAAASSDRSSLIWPLAIQRFKESPVFGNGLSSWYAVNGELLETHSTYLDLLAGLGLFGTIPIIVGCGWWIFSVLRSLRQEDTFWVQTAILGYAAVIGAAMVADITPYFLAPIMLLGLCIGVGFRLSVLKH